MENQNGSSRPRADLPDDILDLIFSRLPLVSYLRAAFVCKSWSSIRYSRRPLPRRELPWLMLHEKYNRMTKNYCDFFSPLDDKAFRIEGYGFDDMTLCCGSRQGWLVTVKEGRHVFTKNNQPAVFIDDCRVYLFNPFSKIEFQLPYQSRCPIPLSNTREGFNDDVDIRSKPDFIKKAILSSPTAAWGCVVVILTNFDNIAFCRPGDYFWRLIDGSLDKDFEDIVFYKGKLYAVDMSNRVWFCSDDLNSIAATPVGGRQARLELLGVGKLGLLAEGCVISWNYLVECRGELLIVVRHINDIGHTSRFKIYKFVDDPSRCILREERSLGDQMIFLGMNQSESFSASEFTGYRKFKGNRIYFSREPAASDKYDIGFYSMEHQYVGRFLPWEFLAERHFDHSIWVSPTPWYV